MEEICYNCKKWTKESWMTNPFYNEDHSLGECINVDGIEIEINGDATANISTEGNFGCNKFEKRKERYENNVQIIRRR